jgi:hypothetical protein
MMDIVESVNEILNHDFNEIKSSTLVATLLSVYSKLYLNGAQPRLCNKCHEQYYNQLKINGMKKAELFKKAKSRTCKPAWKGNRYIPSRGRHYNNELLTDEQAIELLSTGDLKEKDFFTLPGKKDIEKKPKTTKNKKSKTNKINPEKQEPNENIETEKETF